MCPLASATQQPDTIAVIKCSVGRSDAAPSVCKKCDKGKYDHTINQRLPKPFNFGEVSSSTTR